MGFKHLSHVHTRRYAQGVQHDIDGGSIRKERHIFLGHNPGNYPFVTVATGHFISDRQLFLLRNVNLNRFNDTRIHLLAASGAVERTILVGLGFNKFAAIIVDNAHDLDTNWTRINFHMLVVRGQLTEQGLGDFPVGRNNHIVRLHADDIERNFFAQQNVGERFGQVLGQLSNHTLMTLGNLALELLHICRSIARPFQRRILRGNLHIHHDSVGARRRLERRIANIGCLFTKDGAKQPLLRSQFRFALRRNLTHENIAGFDLRTNLDDSLVGEILQRIFSNVWNIAGDLFGAELGITSTALELFNMDRGVDVFAHQLLIDQNSILEVISAPRHEGHHDVTTQSQFALIRASTIGQHIALSNLLPNRHYWALVEASPCV